MAARDSRPEREQPGPERTPQPTAAQRLRQQGWAPAEWEKVDASAIKALQAGKASPEQQQRALDWILKKACLLGDWGYRPGESDRDTNVVLGRQLVGHQIMKLVMVDLSKVRGREPYADGHEPKS